LELSPIGAANSHTDNLAFIQTLKLYQFRFFWRNRGGELPFRYASFPIRRLRANFGPLSLNPTHSAGGSLCILRAASPQEKVNL